MLIDRYNYFHIKLIHMFKATLSNIVATSHMGLFKFKLINIK